MRGTAAAVVVVVVLDDGVAADFAAGAALDVLVDVAGLLYEDVVFAAVDVVVAPALGAVAYVALRRLVVEIWRYGRGNR